MSNENFTLPEVSQLPLYYGQGRRAEQVGNALVDNEFLPILMTHKWFIAGKGRFLSSPKCLISVLNSEEYTVKKPLLLTRLVYLMNVWKESQLYFRSFQYYEIFKKVEELPRLTVSDGNFLNCTLQNIKSCRGSTGLNTSSKRPNFQHSNPNVSGGLMNSNPMIDPSLSNENLENNPNFRLVERVQETEEEMIDEERAEIIMISPNYPQFDPFVLDDILDEDRRARIIARAAERVKKNEDRKKQNEIYEQLTGLKRKPLL